MELWDASEVNSRRWWRVHICRSAEQSTAHSPSHRTTVPPPPQSHSSPVACDSVDWHIWSGRDTKSYPEPIWMDLCKSQNWHDPEFMHKQGKFSVSFCLAETCFMHAKINCLHLKSDMHTHTHSHTPTHHTHTHTLLHIHIILSFPHLMGLCFFLFTGLCVDLPMWPSDQSTRVPCAVEHHALSGWGSNLSPGVSTYQRIFQIIPMHMMNRTIIPGRKKRDRRWPL